RPHGKQFSLSFLVKRRTVHQRAPPPPQVEYRRIQSAGRERNGPFDVGSFYQPAILYDISSRETRHHISRSTDASIVQTRPRGDRTQRDNPEGRWTMAHRDQCGAAAPTLG